MSFFNNKVAVITGGNSGIGQSIAEEFNEQGAKISIFGRNKDKLAQVQSTLTNAIGIVGDVCKISDLDSLFNITYDKFGKIDVLVANAGKLNL